jgi:Eco57I restriction-modification methylase
MLAGLDGHLVSTAFLEAQLRTSSEPAVNERTARTLREWRSAHAFGPASSVRTILDAGGAPLADALGFDRPTSLAHVDGMLAATLRPKGATALPRLSGEAATAGAVALLVAPWGTRLDTLWRAAVTEALRRAAAWCLVFDGVRLRVVDAGRLYARRFVEFDLDLALDHPATRAALWRSASAAALTSPITHSHSLHALVAASDRHATGVCRSLREGVVVASSDVLSALIASLPRRSAEGAKAGFEQALTIVYRLLFLLFAEARALVPLWHPVYRDSYSVDALREIAERSERAPGLWDTLRAMTRLAHAGCEAGDLRVTPFNGRLFSPARTPLAERRDLDDEAARRAVLALSTRTAPDRAGRERITYRDLGVEQLGAVYETLLDYEPRLSCARSSPGRAPIVTLESGSGVRKATGTFYTPQPIADYLVRRTLSPLTRHARADQILQLRIVDPAMGSGAFLVAACRFLAQEYERALVREGACSPGDLDEAARVAIRRSVAERCLYGVDLNPMAVQLARLSLWLATLAADRPLSFLDHRLQTGDSLLGAWMSNLRQAPPALTRRTNGGPVTPKRRRGDGGPLFAVDAVEGALREALPVRFTLESTPNDSLAQVRLKERVFAAMTAHDAALSRWKRIAHLWCAAWFVDRDRSAPAAAFGSLSDFVLTGRSDLPRHTASRYLEAADAVAEAKRFFHWELEYPEVFFDRDGRRLANAGFDAVIGNPPWDMIRADPGQASRRDEAARVVRFTRDSGVYSAQSDGHANRYQLFVERTMALTRAGGRFGLVLPSGLATDHGCASLRRRLLSACDVDAMVGIDNRRGVFPIHRSVRFLLVTATRGRATNRLACRLDLDDPAELERVGDEPADAADWFRFHLTPATIERLSGPDLAIPSLRDATDLAIAERAAALFPALGSATGWSARFGRELNATDDREAFRPYTNSPPRQLANSLMPVFEGKHVEPFRITLDGLRHCVHPRDAARLLPDRRYQRPRVAYRDVASATNRVTLIAALLPRNSVSTHTVFCLRTPLPLRVQHFLCGLFNSLVVNFLVRLRVTTHVTTAVVERLPIPTAESVPAAFREIAVLARVLARRDDLEAFACLNARVAELYQLSNDEFGRVLSTFPLIPVERRDAAFRRFVQTTPK